MLKKNDKKSKQTVVILSVISVLLLICNILTVTLAFFSQKGTIQDNQSITFGVVEMDKTSTIIIESEGLNIQITTGGQTLKRTIQVVVKEGSGECYLRFKFFVKNLTNVAQTIDQFYSIATDNSGSYANWNNATFSSSFNSQNGYYFYGATKSAGIINATTQNQTLTIPIQLTESILNTFLTENTADTYKLVLEIEVVQTINNGYSVWSNLPASW